jgi:hypothetical protein
MKRFILVLSLTIFINVYGQSDDSERIAVMDILDESGKLSEDEKMQATQFFYTRLAGKLNIIDMTIQREEMERMVKDGRIASQKLCVDESCQIQLGREMAANYIYRSRITSFGDTCTFTAEMVNLTTKMTEKGKGAFADFKCGEITALRDAVQTVATKLTDEREQIKIAEEKAAAEKLQKEKEESEKKEAERIEKEKEDEKERAAKLQTFKKKTKKVRPFAWAGYTGLGLGLAFFGGGIAYNFVKKNYNEKAEKIYLENPSRSEEYLEEARKAGVIRNVFYGVGAGFGAIGIAMFFITKEVPVTVYADDKSVMISYSMHF